MLVFQKATARERDEQNTYWEESEYWE